MLQVGHHRIQSLGDLPGFRNALFVAGGIALFVCFSMHALDVGGGLALLPVVSVTPVPKDRIFDCLRLLRDVSVAAPIAEGTIVVSDALGLGVDFRAARDIASVQ